MLAVYTFPAASSTIPAGPVPVVPRMMDEVPSGVIFDTLFEPELAVYTFPAASSTIPAGSVPVVAKIDEVPSGVIFDTLLEPLLAVYTFPAVSSASPFGLMPVVPRMSAVAVMANIRATEPTKMFVSVLIVAKEASTPRCGTVAVRGITISLFLLH